MRWTRPLKQVKLPVSKMVNVLTFLTDLQRVTPELGGFAFLPCITTLYMKTIDRGKKNLVSAIFGMKWT